MEKLPDPGIDHIVAEVSKSWGDALPKVKMRFGGPTDQEDTVSRRLEYVIEVNAQRGFEMTDWKFTSVIDPEGKTITESVVAIFKRRASTFQEELDHVTRGETP